MTHHFEVEDAKKYGIPKAVLLYNLRFWLQKNVANKKHVHDGYVWTYNSAAAFAEIFPYMNAGSIKNWLLELEKDGIILSANYNESSYDRTKWYTIPSEFSCEKDDETHKKTIAPTVQSTEAKMQQTAPTMQDIAPTVQSLYDTDINHIENTNKKQGAGKNFENETLGAVPNTILADLASVWLKAHPSYRQMADPIQDLPAIRKIAEKIMRTPHFHSTPTETITKFKHFCKAVLSDEFWQKKSLKSISNNIQEFFPLIAASEQGRSLTLAKKEKPQIQLPPQKINLDTHKNHVINGGAVIKL